MAQHEWMHSARRVVEERQAYFVHPLTGAIVELEEDDDELPEFQDDTGEWFPAVLLDMVTAKMLAWVWEHLSPEKQAEYGTYGLAGPVEIGWKIRDAARGAGQR